MRIKSRMVISIDVLDPIGIHVDDQIVLDIVSAKYAGKCFGGKFIVSIDRILADSECVINQQGAPNFGTMSLRCEITAIIYAQDEVIVGCMIKAITRDLIICTTPHANIFIKQSPQLESLTVGQLIPVRVGTVKYSIDSPNIAINGMLYIPSADAHVYAFTGGANPDLHTDVLRRIENEEQLRKNLPAKAVETFEKMMHPMRIQATEGIAIANLVTYAGPPITIQHLGASSIVTTVAPVVDDHMKIINEEQPDQVVSAILENYCAQLRLIREMVETYTQELLPKHVNLWSILAKAKI